MNSFNEMFPLARMFPLAVMLTPTSPFPRRLFNLKALRGSVIRG